MKGLRLAVCAVFMCILSLFGNSLDARAMIYEPITIELPVYCIFFEDFPELDYHIIALPQNGAPHMAEEELFIDENHSAAFTISIDSPGTYCYQVYELEGKYSYIQYDDRIYDVTIYVEALEDDTLKAAVVLNSEETGDKPDTLVFENGVPDAPPFPDDPVTEPTLPTVQTEPTVPTEDPVEPTVTAPPVTDGPSGQSEPQPPGDDPTAGAGIEGEGLLIDVGTVIKTITKTDTPWKRRQVEEFERSFIGRIPVIYIAALIILPLYIVIIRKQNKKQS